MLTVRYRPKADDGYAAADRILLGYTYNRLWVNCSVSVRTTMLKFLLKLLKYACPILLITIPFVAVVGMVTPWSVAEQALGRGWARNAVLIGASYESRGQSFERRTHTYVGLPNSSRPFQTVSVVQENGAVRIEEDPIGLLSVLVNYAALAAGTWWFWMRPRKKMPGALQ